LGLLALVISGCSAGQQVTAADIIAKMRETMKTTQTAQGTTDIAVTINKEGLKTLADTLMAGNGSNTGGSSDKDWTSRLPDSASVTINTWRQSPDKMRVEVDNSTLPGAEGAVLVYDGQKAYAYDPAHNTVYSATPSEMLDKAPAELKAVLQGLDAQQTLDNIIAASDVKLAGTEKVAGLDAYRLDITPKPEAADKLQIPQMFQMQAGLLIKDLRVSLWVDKDRWIPLKVTLEHPNIGKVAVTTSKIDLNKPIDSSKFVLQVPGGAKTVDLDTLRDKMGPKSTTLPEAKAQASRDGWQLLEPQYVPSGATLIEVLQQPTARGQAGNVSGVVLNYSSPSVDFSITEGKSKYEKGLGDAFSGIKDNGATKQVPLRGVTATAFSPAGANWTALIWQEKNNGIWVAIHGKLSVDEAVKIAESLK